MCCRSVFRHINAVKPIAAEEVGRGRAIFRTFQVNGGTSNLDFNDEQLMTVLELKIKMAVINRKRE